MQKQSFTREEHLKDSNAIKAVFEKGIVFKARCVNVYLLKRDNDLGLNRAAFTIRKGLHIKKAVVRNRLKRVLREAYRKHKHLLPAGYDIVILAKNMAGYTKSSIIEGELAYVFKEDIKK